MAEYDIFNDSSRDAQLPGNDPIDFCFLLRHGDSLPVVYHQELALECLERGFRLLHGEGHASSHDELAASGVAEPKFDLCQNLRISAQLEDISRKRDELER